MSPVESVAARVLAEHGYATGILCGKALVCCCGYWRKPNDDETLQYVHAVHVAAEIAAALRADEGLVEAIRWALRSDGIPAPRTVALLALDAITTDTGSTR